ncbi:MAG: hypothetical protein KDK70_15715 [Myxococcales bacterium]|nr:hypothetical protein [Myxococcales bacterium]
MIASEIDCPRAASRAKITAMTFLARPRSEIAPRSARRRRLALGLPMWLLACTGDDAAGDGPGSTSATSATSAPTSTASTTSTTSTASVTAGSGTDSGSTTQGASTAADSSTGPGEPVDCGEQTCALGEICMVPCCGGPAPGCDPAPPGGDCGLGTLDPGGAECCINDPDPRTCMQMDWCVAGPCIPDPPSCVYDDLVTCNEFECTVRGGCFGQLHDGVLDCRGCK